MADSRFSATSLSKKSRKKKSLKATKKPLDYHYILLTYDTSKLSKHSKNNYLQNIPLLLKKVEGDQWFIARKYFSQCLESVPTHSLSIRYSRMGMPSSETMKFFFDSETDKELGQELGVFSIPEAFQYLQTILKKNINENTIRNIRAIVKLLFKKKNVIEKPISIPLSTITRIDFLKIITKAMFAQYLPELSDAVTSKQVTTHQMPCAFVRPFEKDIAPTNSRIYNQPAIKLLLLSVSAKGKEKKETGQQTAANPTLQDFLQEFGRFFQAKETEESKSGAAPYKTKAFHTSRQEPVIHMPPAPYVKDGIFCIDVYSDEEHLADFFRYPSDEIRSSHQSSTSSLDEERKNKKPAKQKSHKMQPPAEQHQPEETLHSTTDMDMNADIPKEPPHHLRTNPTPTLALDVTFNPRDERDKPTKTLGASAELMELKSGKDEEKKDSAPPSASTIVSGSASSTSAMLSVTPPSRDKKRKSPPSDLSVDERSPKRSADDITSFRQLFETDIIELKNKLQDLKVNLISGSDESYQKVLDAKARAEKLLNLVDQQTEIDSPTYIKTCHQFMLLTRDNLNDIPKVSDNMKEVIRVSVVNAIEFCGLAHKAINMGNHFSKLPSPYSRTNLFPQRSTHTGSSSEHATRKLTP